MPARDAALELARRLNAAGHEALFAGGCVRDRLLGHRAEGLRHRHLRAARARCMELFPGANEVGAHFGVVIAKHGGHHVEIATFRTDGSYRDGRRPETVTFSTPQEDAQRRDFTINGLFENPETGEVIDYVGGLADLQAGVHPRHRRSGGALHRGRPAPAARGAFRHHARLRHRAGHRRGASANARRC